MDASQYFTDFADFQVTAYQLYTTWNGRENSFSIEESWKSKKFRVPSQDCRTPTFLSNLKGCKLDGFDFGPGQLDLQVFPNVTSKEDCFEKCIKKGCVSYTLNVENGVCKMSNSKEKDLVYFCNEANFTVRRSNVLCRSISQMDKDEVKWALKKRAWLKNPGMLEVAHDLSQCKEKCKNCSVFSWHPNQKICEIVYDEEAEVCQIQGLDCGELEFSPTLQNYSSNLIFNDKSCIERQDPIQCSSQNYQLFPKNSTYQCATYDDTYCRFFKKPNHSVFCNQTITDNSTYDIACFTTVPLQKETINCCALYLNELEHVGVHSLSYEWGKGCNDKHNSLTKEIEVIEVREPTDTTCRIKLELLEHNLVSTFGEFQIRGFRSEGDRSNNTKHLQWQSERFRVFFPDCKNPLEKIEKCSKGNYKLGNALLRNETGQVKEYVSISEKECFQECHSKKQCTYFSWNISKCITLEIQDVNQIYFCQENGTTVYEREFLCKKANEDNADSWTVSKYHSISSPTIYSNESLGRCWKDLCGNCSFFSWNQDTKQCNVSNENSEICTTPRRSKCSEILDVGLIEDFITVHSTDCIEKNMTEESHCTWEEDFQIYRQVKLLV